MGCGIMCLLEFLWAAPGLMVAQTADPSLAERLQRNLLLNGDFEAGLEMWSTDHHWYARGEGLSRWEVDEAAAKQGKRCLKVTGANNRGIALQDTHPPLPACRVSGWLRCENLQGVAQILVEFIATDGRWLSGIPIGQVTGTADWTFVSQTVEMPPEAATLRVDLLTSEPNTGTAWFDEVSVVPQIPPDDGRPPTPPRVRVRPVEGEDGALAIEWEADEEADVLSYQVYWEASPDRLGMNIAPRAVVRRNARSYTVRGLQPGLAYDVGVAAVDVSGRLGVSDFQHVRPRDLRPPQPPRVEIESVWSTSPQARLEWQPHPVDEDIDGFEILRRRGDGTELVRALPADGRRASVDLQGEADQLAVVAVDRTGNRSPARWQWVVPAGTGQLEAGFASAEGVRLESRRGPAMLAQEGWNPTRLPSDLTELLKREAPLLSREGSVLSLPLARPPEAAWGQVFWKADLPEGTGLQVDILDGEGNLLLEDVRRGQELADLTSYLLRLRATLIGDGVATPTLQAWWVTLKQSPQEGNLTGWVVDAVTGRPIAGAVLAVVTPNAVRRTRSDDRGRFTCPPAPSESARLRITAPGYLACSLRIRPVIAGAMHSPVYQPLAVALTPQKQAPGAWLTGPLIQVFRDSVEPREQARGPADSGQARGPAPTMVAARGETEAIQLAVRPDQDWAWTRVTWPEEAERLFQITVRAVGYIPLPANSRATPAEELVRRAPGDFPDPLLDLPFVPLRAHQTQPFFVTVTPRRDTRPGTYTLPLQVELPAGSFTMPVQVQVSLVRFPERTRLWFTNWYNASHFARYHGVPEWGNEHFAWMRLYARLMAGQHQNVLLMPLGLVEIWRREDGSFYFDFWRFDRYVETFAAEGAAQRLELSHVGGRKTGAWEEPEFIAYPLWATDRQTGEQVQVPLEDFLRALRDHLKARGRLTSSMLHIADEPIPVNVESWKQLSDRVHRAVPDLPRIDAIHVPSLDGFLEVWVPQLNYFAQWLDTFRQQQRKGDELWFYTAWVPQDRWPNRLIDYPLIKTRILQWMNPRYGATGFLHWGWNHWGDVMVGELQSPGDAFIVYPGPAGSLRSEAQRDGIEDAELLWLTAEALHRQAGEKGAPTPQQAAALLEPLLKEVIPDFTGFTRDPAELEAVRREVLGRLEEAGAAE